MIDLVEVNDAHFAWMLGGSAPSPDLRLPPGGVDEPDIIKIVRKMAAKMGNGQRLGGMIVVDGEVVGLCGNKPAVTEAGSVEIGYSIAPSRRGCGYATQAVAALIELARMAGMSRLVAETTATNIASQRVLEHNGFSRVGIRSDTQDGDLIVWQRNLKV